ncbi:hypothetical protein AB9K29_03000 [Phaeobacter italicus]|uniref:hypothetical protein n=1 Tax=Phaeobacter italicus TaxID=481446 RepID=UPI003519691A
MKYDPTSGFWLDRAGVRFLKNEFRPDKPTYIRVTEWQWSAEHLNREHRLVWPKRFPREVKPYFESALRVLMRRKAPSILRQYDLLLRHLCCLEARLPPLTKSNLFNYRALKTLWTSLRPSYRPHFRTLICMVLEEIDPRQGQVLASEIQSWGANRRLEKGKSILEWDPHAGAMTSAEIEVLRRHLSPAKNENIETHFARVFTRLTLNTLRRPSQLLEIEGDGLRRHKTRFGETAEVRIPFGKGQAARGGRWETISTELAADIEAYRARPEILGSSLRQEVLLPYVTRRKEGDRIEVRKAYGALAKACVQNWVASIGVKSPRTGDLLSVSLRRIRHTGATHMAMQGYSLQLIADVLQHDIESSARYYIDAVGVEFIPAFEKMDRNLGGRFSALRDAWFSGKIVDGQLSVGQPIFVPKGKAPAIVGECGSKDACGKHPLFSCYTCEHFLAFRSADHHSVLDYLQEEYEHWRTAEFPSGRSKVMKDFDRAAVGVREVIDQIENVGKIDEA